MPWRCGLPASFGADACGRQGGCGRRGTSTAAAIATPPLLPLGRRSTGLALAMLPAIAPGRRGGPARLSIAAQCPRLLLRSSAGERMLASPSCATSHVFQGSRNILVWLHAVM